MTDSPTQLFLLYQMGTSEEYTWFSVVGVFSSEAALREHTISKGIAPDLEILAPSPENEIILTEPREFVAVLSHEGEVPDVELAEGL